MEDGDQTLELLGCTGEHNAHLHGLLLVGQNDKLLQYLVSCRYLDVIFCIVLNGNQILAWTCKQGRDAFGIPT